MTCPLSDLGLVGWDNVALTILSALAADVPVLLYGDAGAAKTDGAQVLASSILGGKLRWATYECPYIQMDDIVGYVKPKSLNENVLQFTGHPSSVWNVNAVCFDEINRAHHSTANKFLEIVRTKRVYNMETHIQHVFATANPPTQEYGATAMNAPMVSRFAVVPVPSFAELSEDEARSAITGSLSPKMFSWWPVQGHPDIDQTIRVRALLARHGIHMTGRSAKYMAKMLGMSQVIPAKRTPATMTLLVLSCVPEAYPVCRSHRDMAVVQSELTSFFATKDDLPPAHDWPLYLAALRARAHTCQSLEEATRLHGQLATLRKHMPGKEADVQDVLTVIVPKLAPYLNTSDTLEGFLYQCLTSAM